MVEKHLPHNCADELHDDLVQDVEKLQHQLGLFSHFPHNDSKSDKEANQTCMTQNMFTLISLGRDPGKPQLSNMCLCQLFKIILQIKMLKVIYQN